MERSCVHIAVLVVAEDPASVDLAAATFVSDRVATAGHRVVAQEIVESSESAIRDQLSRWIGQGHIDAIVTVGAGDAAVAALGPLVSAPLQGLTDQLRLLARDRGGEGKPAAARCAKKFVFVLPAEVPALGPVLNQLVLPQLDSTQPRNLVSEMPRHTAVPQTLPAEKTASGAGLVPKFPAPDKRKTGANVIARPNKVDDPTKPIELDSLEKKLAQEEARFPSHDAPTRPHIDIASMLPPVPPGADPDTAETPALPDAERRPGTWDDVATPPTLTVQPSRLRPGAVGTAVGNNDKTVVRPTPTRDEKTVVRPTPTRDEKTVVRPTPTSDDKTAVRPAPTRPTSQTSRGLQPTPAIGSQTVRPPASVGIAKGTSIGTAKPASTATPVPTVPSVVPAVKPVLPSIVPAVPSVVPAVPSVVPVIAKAPAAAAPTAAVPAAKASTKEQTTPGVMSPLGKPRVAPVAESRVAPAAESPAAPAASAPIAKSPATPAAPAEASPRLPTPVSGVQTATAVSASQATSPKHPDVVDTAALAAAAANGASAAVLAALAESEELDPASSADIIEAVPADAPSFDTRTPPPVPVRPPTPRAPARPGIVPQMTQTPIDAKTAEAKLAAQARSATPPAVTRLANAALPRSPDFAQPELLDFSEGVSKKRRSRTGTALVRRKTSTSILMYLALLAAAAAGFLAVVHFFPHGEATKQAGTPGGSDVATGSAGSATSASATGSATATATGSADLVATAVGSAGSSDVVAKGSDPSEIEVDTGSATPPAHPTGAAKPTTRPATTKPATTRPEVTKPATTKPETTKPETTKPETTKPETAKPAIVAEDGCDEVGCVLEKYQRECCARFKPAESGFHPKDEVPDALDKTMVKAGIERVKPKVIACGEKIATKGTVKLAITVAPGGNISDISVSEAPDPALGDCVLAAVKRASFGKSVNGASFTYPFAF